MTAVFNYTLRALLKERIFIFVSVFGSLCVFFSMLLGGLGVEAKNRIILNSVFTISELISILGAVYITSTTFLAQAVVESDVVILTRKISRNSFLAGKVFAIIAAGICGYILMFITGIFIFLINGIKPELYFLKIAIGACGKIFLVVFISTLFSMITTSGISTIVITLLFYILGNLRGEMEFLYEKMASPAKKLFIKTLIFLLPDFNILDFKNIDLKPSGVVMGAFKVLAYSFCTYVISISIFRKKEF